MDEWAKTHEVTAARLNWQLCNKEINSIQYVDGLKERNIFYSFIRFIGRFIVSFGLMFKPNKIKRGRITFFTSAENQYAAFFPVLDKVNHAKVIELCNPFKKERDAFFPLFRANIRTLLNVSKMLREYNGCNDAYIRRAYNSRGDLLALAPSLWITAVTYLEEIRPKVVIVSNDLVLWTRAILFAAKFLDIKTVYLQHAAVSKFVPPLETDFALLDGLDAASKYIKKSSESKTKIYLTGGARHDDLANLKALQTRSRVTKVGICVNMVDDLDAVFRLVNELAKDKSLCLTMRAHPRESRKNKIFKFSVNTKISWSDSKVHSVSEFINEQDVVVGGDSSILVDAVIGKRRAISIKSMGVYEDYLGLEANGLIEVVTSALELRAKIKKKRERPNSILRNFYAPHGTIWNGRSAKLISDAINEIAFSGKVLGPYIEHNEFKNVFELQNKVYFNNKKVV